MKKVVKLLANIISNQSIRLTVVWMFVVLVIGYLSQHYLPFTPTYPYFDSMLAPLAPSWLARWGGFDGVHYITIVREGYIGTGLIQAFFPVYPLLIYALNVVKNPLITGLGMSYVCILLSAVVLTRLPSFLKAEKNQKNDLVRLFALLTFPTALFFLGMYTESLFLLLVLCTWQQAWKKHWLTAALLAGIASGTRIVGIALFPALALQAYLDYRSSKHVGLPWKTWATLCLSCVGLVAYMFFLTAEFHDPLYFLHVQHAFGGGRQENLVLFPQVVYRYIKILVTSRPIDWSYFAYVQELVLTLEVGVVLTIISIKKTLRHLPLLVFSWIVFLLPPLTGTFSSMPRYVLVIFPIYFVYAAFYRKHKRAATLLFLLHAILLVINILLFMQGKWVA